MRWGWLFVGLAVLAGSKSERARADDAKPAETPATKTTAGEAEIRKAIDAYVAAFNAGDAKALAALYAPDAHTQELDGRTLEGRAAVEEEYTGFFQAHPGAKIALSIDAVRFLGPDLAVEDGTNRVTPRAEEGAPWNNRSSVIYARKDGRWLIAGEREYPGEEPTQRDRIKELEWLVGDWVDESEDSVIHTSCRLSPDGAFLVRDYRVEVGGKAVESGTERIGWDTQTKQFKSWEFDSEGCHGESLWARAGANQWVVKARSVRPDGCVDTETHHLTPERGDTIHWKTVDRTVGDAALPDILEYVLVRRPPAPKH